MLMPKIEWLPSIVDTEPIGEFDRGGPENPSTVQIVRVLFKGDIDKLSKQEIHKMVSEGTIYHPDHNVDMGQWFLDYISVIDICVPYKYALIAAVYTYCV
jgi:hypothetical protein